MQDNSLEKKIQDRYLTMQGFYRGPVIRDGNCLFRAVAHGIFHNSEQHQNLREAVVDSMRENWSLVAEALCDVDKERYLREISMLTSYGGEPEIIIICHTYNARVLLYMGGLKYPVCVREYGSSDAATTFSMAYVSDGLIDAGHYDLVVRTTEERDEISGEYEQWKFLKMQEVTLDDALVSVPHYGKFNLEAYIFEFICDSHNVHLYDLPYGNYSLISVFN